MLFFDCNKLKSIDLSNLNKQKAEDMSYMFEYTSLTSIDLTNFNTSNVITMKNIFAHCYSLTSINVSNLDTTKVEDMSGMFYGDKIPKIDFSNINTKMLNI